MELKTQYAPRLAIAPRDEIADILVHKAEDVGSAGLTDYIGFTLESMQDQRERIKFAIADLQMLLKATDGQEKIIKAEVRNLLESNGIDSIKGDRISSITLFNPAPKKKVSIIDKEAVLQEYGKLTVDTTALKKAIENGDVSEEVAVLEVEHQEQSIKLNKRKTV